MTIIGTFTESNNGFTGTLRTLALDVKVRFVPNDKASDNALDYRLLASGNYEIGAAWKKVSQAERPHLSVALDAPSFPEPVYTRLITGENGGHTLIWPRSKSE